MGQSRKIIVYYDQNQKVVKEIFYVEDTLSMALEGPYSSYYVSGALREKGFYSNNQATGFWEYFYESGNPKMKGELKDGSNFGHWKYYYENGNLSMEGPIFDGQRQDFWTHYYENGSVKRQGKYLNNRMVGIWNYFYESQQGGYGSLKAQAFYEDGKGTYKEFYPNGELKAEGLYIDGKSEGEWIFYHPNGAIEAKGSYLNGTRQGKWVYFHANGEKAAEGVYTDGLREGDWRFYHKNGQLSSEGKMQEGQKDGYWVLYNRWGDYKGEGNFVKGEGEYKEFHQNGRLKTIGMIKDDKNEGEWLYYYPNGRLEGKASFENGRGTYIGYYPDGSKNMEGLVENGQRVEVWKMYKKSGELSGFYKVYYENDAPVYKIVEDKKEKEPEGSDKPEYRFKVTRFRNFEPKIGEFKALILATNPLAPLHGSLPVSVEYYIQERLGYDLQLTYLRKPFFQHHDLVQAGGEYYQGFSFAVKQKFYQPEDKLGMFYYGHEFRVSPIMHFHQTDNPSLGRDGAVSMDELKVEYSVVFGNRITRDAGRKGVTLDVFLGIGAGYRYISKNYAEEELDESVFGNVSQRNFSVPIRFGFNLGYAFNRLK
ncbi:toxin-antitoxin system YwqK family antitoxin [Nafulsella turpanensis]|uniref:toxin-antitoxin system YwqK family antitoxin n=1 Tax=Nafulsella turpanensis TaxID=1265690 RepID=UPI0003629341|nr:toxin-antitoxin system YwqK family antitoxin [Nafulsella turpanensis]